MIKFRKWLSFSLFLTMPTAIYAADMREATLSYLAEHESQTDKELGDLVNLMWPGSVTGLNPGQRHLFIFGKFHSANGPKERNNKNRPRFEELCNLREHFRAVVSHIRGFTKQ